jgi:hypothetical protein
VPSQVGGMGAEEETTQERKIFEEGGLETTDKTRETNPVIDSERGESGERD